MEAHEGVTQGVRIFALDILFEQVSRNRVVDIEQGDRLPCDAGADILADRTIDVHLTGNRDAARSQPAVDITRLKAELLRERGPAFVREDDIVPRALVGLRPVEQGQLKLRHAGQQVGILVALYA